VNEFRVGYNRSIDHSTAEGAFGTDGARDIGLKNTSTKEANFVKLPGFGPTGFSSIGQGFSAALFTTDNLYQINENMSIKKGNHTLKFGGDLRPNHLSFSGDFPSNPVFAFNGKYTGDSVGDFLLGLFDNTFSYAGDTSANPKGMDLSFYASDNWKVTPNLNLTFGLRYEYFMPRDEENNKFTYLDFSTGKFVPKNPLFNSDANNFAPRIGFAYSPWEKTAIRGGFGVYYDLIAGNETQFMGLLNPPNGQVTSLFNPDVPIYKVEEMYPDPEFAAQSAPNIVDPNSRIPYVYQYNLNIQKELKGHLLEVGYVGSTGHKLNRRNNLNLAFADPSLPKNERVPYPQYTDLLASLNNGWSNYNGLNVRLEKRYSGGLFFLLSYTLGKYLDIGGPDEYVHDNWKGTFGQLRGPAFMDQRHRVSMSWVYELPFGKEKKFGSDWGGALDAVLGGWQVNGIVTFQSGRQVTPLISGDWAQIGGRRKQPPIRLGEGNDKGLRSDIRNNPVLFPYFNVDDFVLPPALEMGDAGRGVLYTPGVNNWDIGFNKSFYFGETFRAQVRIETFNIWNHAQFLGLGITVNNPNFGRITSARSPRDIQFGFKLLW
jgi:hypothetical protein